MASNNQTPSQDQLTIEYITTAGVLIEKVAADTEKAAAEQRKIASLIPAVVDALVAGERMADTPQGRENITVKLADHATCLAILHKVAGHRNQVEKAASALTIGAPTDPPGTPKQASANYPGQRTTAPRPSDMNFAQAFGLDR